MSGTSVRKTVLYTHTVMTLLLQDFHMEFVLICHIINIMVNIIDIVIKYISKFNICITNTQKVKLVFYIAKHDISFHFTNGCPRLKIDFFP